MHVNTAATVPKGKDRKSKMLIINNSILAHFFLFKIPTAPIILGMHSITIRVKKNGIYIVQTLCLCADSVLIAAININPNHDIRIAKIRKIP